MSYILPSICLFNTGGLATWTGTTGDTSLKTFTLKGGTVGPSDKLEFILLADMTSSQTTTLRMGSTDIISNATSATISLVRKGNIHFRNSVSSQVLMAAASQTDAQSSTVALLTPAENFANDVVFDIRSNLSAVGNTFKLRTFSLILWRAPAV